MEKFLSSMFVVGFLYELFSAILQGEFPREEVIRYVKKITKILVDKIEVSTLCANLQSASYKHMVHFFLQLVFLGYEIPIVF